ncbi:LapA family protein [Bosea sp. BH3]|uniref:LapA family protein n=1 Tax=Bosea sp. BH3 TaxID=2871701 RepID=UPI0021CB4EAF|nr:LapA family protein [Bosea sp. BH3]MCU4179417.1 LapA family protein [Bosea sp. BH3]
MKAFLKALVLIPIALVIVLFAVANRAPVRVSLDPFSRDLPMLSYELPLFLVVLAAIFVGVLIGGLASWIAQGKHRKAARRGRREVEALRSETQALRSAVPDSALPALTSGRN